MITQTEVLTKLEQNAAALRAMGVAKLALFGSTARHEQSDRSDIDLLVDFAGRATFDQYFDLQEYLASLFEEQVDLVTLNSLSPLVRPKVEREAVTVAGFSTVSS